MNQLHCIEIFCIHEQVTQLHIYFAHIAAVIWLFSYAGGTEEKTPSPISSSSLL